MIYRVRADLSFKTKREASEVLALLQPHLGSSFTIPHAAGISESGWIASEHCYHDEDPVRPCVLLFLHKSLNVLPDPI